MIRTISCHCGEVRLQVNAELQDVIECNCSTCGKSGYLSWYVPIDSVRLDTPSRGMSSYFWRLQAKGSIFVRSVELLPTGLGVTASPSMLAASKTSTCSS